MAQQKEPFAESIPSPLVVPDSSIWNQSLSIPTTPPVSDTSIVKVYSTSSAHRMTADSSVSGSRAFIAYSTYNNTSSARLTDWIDTQFGTAYVLKVYKGDPNSGGTLLPAGGSGSNDGWFFDYSSGVLNFNGSGLPSGVTDTNIYMLVTDTLVVRVYHLLLLLILLIFLLLVSLHSLESVHFKMIYQLLVSLKDIQIL